MPSPTQPHESLGELGEDAVVRLLTRDLRTDSSLLAGPGDDCAVIARPNHDHLLLKTDCVIEGVHFEPETEPEAIGWKAAARVVSDFAAMGGGSPRHALVTLVAPADRTADWAKRLYAGIERCGREFAFCVVGGETSRPPQNAPLAMISIAMSGEISPERCVLRSGARIGDEIFVTGALGGSLAGKHLNFTPRLAEAAWLTQKLGTNLHAMMDLSDGLAKDLPRLAQASNAGFHVNREAVPKTAGCTLTQALGDGEDYELLFTAAPASTEGLISAWPGEFPELPLTRIGTIVTAEESQMLEGGWDPFFA